MSDHAFSLRTDRKIGIGRRKFKRATRQATLSRERRKSAGVKFKRGGSGGATFKFAFRRAIATRREIKISRFTKRAG